MEDIIGFIIFLFIVYRSISDRKKGKQRTSSYRRRTDESPLLNEEQESVVDLDSMEEVAGKILEIEGWITEDEEDLGWGEEQVEVIQQEQSFSKSLSEPVKVNEEPESVAEVTVEPLAKPEVEVVCPRGSSFTEVDLKQAVIWSEILQKPKALRSR
ncbi:MAG: hypothetical protein ACOX2N_08585 [Peptococcia bacterium]